MTVVYRRHPSFAPPAAPRSSSSSRVKDAALLLSLAVNIILLWSSKRDNSLTTTPIQFTGGHPQLHSMTGNCYCSGQDNYCMCNPSLAIDLVIVVDDTEELLLVRRKDTDQLATMGGFVDVGETVEAAVWRELREETGIKKLSGGEPRLIGLYSDPARDNRRHTASAVFGVHVKDDPALHQAVAADDVKEIVRVPWNEVDQHDYFADHKTIIHDYMKILRGKASPEEQPEAEVDASAVKRSLCPFPQ